MYLAAAAAAMVLIAAIAIAVRSRTEQPEPTPTTTVPSTTTAQPTTTTGVSADQAAATTAWRTLWGAASMTPESEAAARAVAEPLTITRVKAYSTQAPRVITSSPDVALQGQDQADITDCVIFEPPATADPAVAMVGKAEHRDGNWRITEIAPRNGTMQACAPAGMATAAVTGYEAYWDAAVKFWAPADPASPLVAETLTGKQRAHAEGLLREHRQRGAEYRGRPATHPEVIELRSSSEMVLLDCQDTDPLDGLYDSSTGDRLPDVPPVKPGQRDLVSAVMRLEEGRWKVSDIQGRTGVTCDHAPTEKGLPLVGA